MAKKKAETKDTEAEKDKRHVQEFNLMLDRMVKRGIIV